MNTHSSLSLFLIICFIACQEDRPVKPKNEVPNVIPKEVANATFISSNIFGDSIKAEFLQKDSTKWHIRYNEDTIWHQINNIRMWAVDTNMIGANSGSEMDYLFGFKQKIDEKIKLSFFYRSKSFDHADIEKLYRNKKNRPLKESWEKVFPGYNFENIEAIKVIAMNLDKDSENEKVIWVKDKRLYNTSFLIDKKKTNWETIGIFGPGFLDQPPYINEFGFLVFPRGYHRSDHSCQYRVFYTRINKKYVNVFSITDYEEVFKKEKVKHGYYAELSSKILLFTKQKIIVSFNFSEFEGKKLINKRILRIAYLWNKKLKKFIHKNNNYNDIGLENFRRDRI